MGKTTETSTYCRKCFYDLRGIGTASRCPECGRAFDLADPKTFRTRRPRGIWRRLRWVVYPLLMIVLAASAGVGWLWWEWRQEQQVIAWARAHVGRGGSFDITRLVGPAWVQGRIGRWKYLLERLDQLRVESERPVARVEFPLARARQLTQLTLDGRGLGDALMSEVGRLRELKVLWLWNTSITDDGLAQLSGCRRLEQLTVWGGWVGRQGLAPLAGHPESTRLSLMDTSVDDTAVPVIAGLTKLKELDLRGTKITPSGLAELKKALPNCQILSPDYSRLPLTS